MENENALMQRTEESDARTMVAVVRNRLAAVRELLKAELKGPSADHPDGVDYGMIPGTKKLTLLQPGAEKIALMFQFSPSYTFTRVELAGGHLEVTALCQLTHSATGRIVGQAEGTASTMESKHRYRGAGGKACPECGAMACIPSKKEYGGGYFCKEANGGCGKKWKPGTPECKALDELPTTKQENPDPADQRNTVSKIAQKRAFVSAVKCASAASEVFTVDMDEAQPETETRQKVSMPTPKAKQDAPKTGTATGHEVVGIIEDVATFNSKPDAAKPWTKWGVKIDGVSYGTFDANLGAKAVALKGQTVMLQWKEDGKYRTALDLDAVHGAVPADKPEDRTGEPPDLPY
jgi:hypothetical protein